MKLYYPNDASEQEYIADLTAVYKKEYSSFTEEQICTMLQKVVNNIRAILAPSIVRIKNQTCRNIKILQELFTYSHEKYCSLDLAPKQPFINVYLLGTRKNPENIIPFVLKKQGEKYTTFFTEGQSKEAYADFVAKMTKQCVVEITQATEKNIPYELKQQYKQAQQKNDLSKQDSSNGVKPKKTVHWAQELEQSQTTYPVAQLITNHSGHFKHSRSSNEDGFKLKDDSILKKPRLDL